MIKKYIIFANLLVTAMAATACSSTQTTNTTSNNTPTGYWYLGDNGEQQWRTLNPNNTINTAPKGDKKNNASLSNR